MIKSAATSVSGSLALGKGGKAAPADDAAVSTDFAALLDSTQATGQDLATDPAAALEQPAGKTIRQAAGKKLPLALQDAAAALADTAKPANGPADAKKDDSQSGTSQPSTATEIVLPGLVVPISLQLPQTPTPVVTQTTASARQSTTATLAKTAALQAGQSPVAAAVAEAVQPAKGEKTDARSVPATAAQILASFALPQPGDAAAAAASTTPKAAITTTAPAKAADPGLVAAIPAAVPETTPDAELRLTTPSAEKPATSAKVAVAQPAPTTTPAPADQVRVTVTPAEQPTPITTSTNALLASAQTASVVIRADAAEKPAAAAKAQKPAEDATSVADASADTTARLAPAQAAVNAGQPAPAALPRRGAAAVNAATPSTDASAAPVKTAAAETPAASATPGATAAPQPQLAVQDGQSLSQITAPVAATPATGGVAQSGHDFATLVDRLVEARDAASPASVHASITHSEFGQVSLRFDQNASGLSVSMSSADPDFARAIQASSAQSQMAGDNGSNAPRQDTSQQQQQTAGSPSGQPQSQAQSQAQSFASARDERNTQTRTDTRTGRTNDQQPQSDEAADTRSGIYA